MIENITHNIKGLSSYKIIYNGSSSIEPTHYKGISHLIEHCMCEQIKNKFDQKFNQLAITWNASTSNQKVCFYMSGLSKYVRKNIVAFTEAIINYDIPYEVFEREKNIVITEYYQVYTDQDNAFVLNFNRKHLNSCESIGYIEDLQNLTYEDFINYKNTVFAAPSKIIYKHAKNEKDITLNDINIPIMFNDIKEYQTTYNFGEYKNYPLESYADFHNQRIICFYSILQFDNEYKNYLYSKVFNYCLTGGLNSILYKKLRDKLQCVYSISGEVVKIDNKQFGINILAHTTDDKKEIVLKNLKKSISTIQPKLTKKLFNDCIKLFKNSYKISNILNWENIISDEALKCRELVLNKQYSYEEFKFFANTILNSNVLYITDEQYV